MFNKEGHAQVLFTPEVVISSTEHCLLSVGLSLAEERSKEDNIFRRLLQRPTIEIIWESAGKVECLVQ